MAARKQAKIEIDPRLRAACKWIENNTEHSKVDPAEVIDWKVYEGAAERKRKDGEHISVVIGTHQKYKVPLSKIE